MEATDIDLAANMRNGLRRLAKAVVVITTVRDGQRHAMAATAVSELSMDPPSLLICVNRSASLHPVLATGASFCVNILETGQMDVSRACSGARKGEARFELGTWKNSATGVPWLAGAQASFECECERIVDYGTHSIFIGLVVDATVHGDVNPLVYVDGGYVTIGEPVA